MDVNILQTKSWEQFLNDQGSKTFRIEKPNFTAMCVLKKTALGNYLFLPYGPAIKAKKDLASALAEIKKLAIENNCFFFRIEPTTYFSEEEMRKLSLAKTKHIEPEDTLILNLEEPEEELVKHFNKNKYRDYRNHKNKKISIRTSNNPDDIEIFFSFYKEVAKKDKFQTFEQDYLRKQLGYDFATLYIAEVEEEGKKIPIAANILYKDKNCGYYAHGASDYKHRNLSAGAILLIQMILDSKKAGCKKFDFWGITTSEDPKHPWYGFTQFKKLFGGTPVHYSGTYDYKINKAKYQAYKALRTANRIKRKLIKK